MPARRRIVGAAPRWPGAYFRGRLNQLASMNRPNTTNMMMMTVSTFILVSWSVFDLLENPSGPARPQGLTRDTGRAIGAITHSVATSSSSSMAYTVS